jgi:hypothetical protein
MKIIYLKEIICGGSDASGGGCGAPRGCYVEEKKEGLSYRTSLVEHNLEEVFSKKEIQEIENGEFVYRARVEFRPCIECRNTF